MNSIGKSNNGYTAIVDFSKLNKSENCIAVFQFERLIFANQAFCDKLQVHSSDFIDKPYYEIFSKYNLDSIREFLIEVEEHSSFFNFLQTEMELPNGENVMVDINMFKVSYLGNEATIAIINDCSDKYEILKELQNSENKLSFLTQSAFEGIILHNNGVVLDVNENFANNVGLKREEAIGRNIFSYLRNTEDREVLKEKMSMKDTKPYVLELIKEDATPYFAEIESKQVDYKGQSVRIAAIRDISERINLQQKLVKSEQRLSNLLSNLQGVAYRCLIHQEWTMKYLSAGCLDLTEYTAEELIDDKVLSYNTLIKEEDRIRVWVEVDRALEKNQPFELKYRIITRTGKEKWVFEKGKRIIDDGIHYLEGFISDITNLNRVETEVLNQKQILESIYRAAPTGIGIVVDRVITRVNPQICEITKYSEEELLNKSARMFYKTDEEYHRVGVEKYKQINLHGLGTVETQWVRKDGVVVDILLSSSPIDFGDLNKGIIFTVLDITDQKNHERAIAISEKRLLNSQILSRTGSWSIDLKTMEVQATEQARLLYGFDDMSTVSPEDVQQVHCEEYREQLDEALNRLISGVAPHKEVFELENLKSGIRYDVLSIAEFDPETQIIEGTIQDISDLKHVERELLEKNRELLLAKEKAEEADRLKSAFLANISHEIRTPMNGIMGFANLLKEQNLSEQKQKHFIEIIQNSGNRMLNTLNDLIDISRIESGQVDVQIEELRLGEFLNEVYHFFKPVCDEKELDFSFVIPVEIKELVINTDKSKLESIITNLIKNAIKFTHEGGVELSVEQVDSHLKFTIIDTGIGIPEDKQRVIFDRFVQADLFDSEAFEGSGLGLSIAKSYLEMLSGKIWLKSQVDIGSIFYFQIPLLLENDEKMKIEIDHAPSVLKGDKIKVLIAEDDETAMRYISVIMEEVASDILYARDGASALKMIQQNPEINLVLLDMKMPKMSGFEVIHQVRTFNQDIIVIAQTAYAMAGDREKALEMGCNDYIAKPYRVNDLIKKVNQYF